ncbi:putative bifunctional diguanylate cyclase/phosphodiesterase [Aureimonas psammosilenae]|uniref:putative bifunctional diguanylate cyclase/phosphodiesterase n=1 Tax=Aureimonas psammosilenae TaxID=2495496 RepID=UPI001260CCF6|nr:EAL domain-containing protein [Aureimonas psammosilenae]
MSIRLKIFSGCLCLTALTGAVGYLAMASQREIGDLASRLYDNSLLSTNSLRSAQTGLVTLGFELAALDVSDASPLAAEQGERVQTSLAAIEADLFLASAGSISSSGRSIVDQTRRRLTKLDLSAQAMTGRLVKREISIARDEIGAAVRVFAADAYDVKGEVGSITERSMLQMQILVAAAAILMIAVVWFLSWTILPALRRAAALARSIANGDLSTKLNGRSGGEGGELLSAMASMQTSLAERFDRFETMVATQANVIDKERTSRDGKLRSTIESLSQGLCIFDAHGRVSMVNPRFLELFDEAEISIGTSATVLAALPSLQGVVTKANEPGVFTHRSADGCIFSVCRRNAPDGGRIVTVEDVTEGHLAAARIDHAASHDGMTGFFNRQALSDHIQTALLSMGPAGCPALLILDIDGLRGVNEAFGHSIGDAVLKLASERLADIAGPDDFLARIGGDEFAIARSGPLPKDGIAGLAAAVQQALCEPYEVEGRVVQLQVSIGLAPAPGGVDVPTTADALILQAELALAAAKASNRKRIRSFEPAMERESQQRRQTEIDLAAALERGELELFYQPYIDVPMHAIAGFEALLRWRHPQRGLVSPGEFIPIAEDLGLIAPIGLWALETACGHAAKWPKDLTVSVNLSPVQFRNESLLDDIATILERTGFEPYRLQLEVTESVFLGDSDGVMAVLTALRALGVRIAMDDFGTGYSSLGYLSRFPFDKVKIDQSFVRDLGKRENLVIVRAIIGLSKAMGLSVMAEGVETRRQMETLVAESCFEMQGYHFAKPMPLSDLPRFMMQFSLDRRPEAGDGLLTKTVG